jgi:hypothetical protein
MGTIKLQNLFKETVVKYLGLEFFMTAMVA